MDNLTSTGYQLVVPNTSGMSNEELTEVINAQHLVLVAVLEDLETIKATIEAL